MCRGREAQLRVGEKLHKITLRVKLSIFMVFSHRARILVQVTIYRRLLIGRDGHLDQSEGYDIS